MANITLTVSGSPQELTQILQRIADLEFWENLEGEETRQNRQRTWSDENVSLVWLNLTRGCREILREIALREEGTPIGVITEKFQLTANQVGGRLSSLGHQINAMGFNEAPRPLEWWPDIGYKLLTAWRNAILSKEVNS